MKKILLLSAVLFVLASCQKDDSGSNNPTVPTNPTDPFAELNLPATPYNYANQPIPAHILAVGADNTPANNPITDQGATLGRVLFFDRNLSANRTVACASCHQSTKGFSDPLVKSLGFAGGLTGRHSMTLVNARYYANRRFFWDERAATLEDQVLMPIQDQTEMGLTIDELVGRVREKAFYATLFSNAFGDTAINSQRISRALAQYVRSVVSYRSKYDVGRAQVANTGDPFPNFTAQENQGKAIFNAPGNCAPCHGTDAHIAPGPRNNGLDATTTDAGVGGVNNVPQLVGTFKSGSLRNVALQAPYMHDGRFSTLEQVIDHYSNGVQNHPNLSPPLRDPQGNVRVMNFTQAQKDALLAFLNTLTDTALSNDPKFQDPWKR